MLVDEPRAGMTVSAQKRSNTYDKHLLIYNTK